MVNKNKKNKNNLVFGRWPQTKMYQQVLILFSTTSYLSPLAPQVPTLTMGTEDEVCQQTRD